MRSRGSIKTWLVFILIIIIAFGALFYFKNYYQPSDKVELTTTEEGGESGKSFAEIELSEEEKLNFDNEAYSNALKSGSLADCEAIEFDKELKQQCLDNLNYSKILKSGDETQCETLSEPNLKQQCYDKIYFSAALDTFDLALCNKISNLDLKENCSNQIKVVMGRTATSESDCDSISDEILKQECLNNYYFSSSIDELNVENCETIMDEKLKERCISTVKQNIEVIELSKQTTTSAPTTTAEVLESCTTTECKDEANYDLAFENKDLSYCNRISDSDKIQECLKEQTESIDQYYLRQAIARRDESKCAKIANDSLQELCENSI